MSTSTWRHLAGRLLDYLTSSPLNHDEIRTIEAWLLPDEKSAFFAQGRADQRHGWNAALVVQSVRPDRDDLIRAALLHDIGKRHSRMGAIARSAVSGWVKLGGRVSGRAASYINHGALGANELGDAEGIVVEFARHHHGPRPVSISESDWALLQRADNPKWVLRGE